MLRQFAISLDQFINVWCFWWIPGGVWADETLSAKAWRTRAQNPWLHRVIDTIFFFEKNHCMQAYCIEVRRADMPKELRQ